MSGELLVIPRVLHRLWLGPDPIPELFAYYEESWRRLHPHWELRLWRDEALSVLQLPPEIPSGFKRRYDIIRLEILRQQGGVIVDMDVEAVRPIDPLLRGVRAFVGLLGRNHVGNQVLGAVPYHPFFARAAELLRETMATAESSSQMAGKGFLRRLLDEGAGRDVTVFPAETFYFEPSLDPPRRPEDFPAVYAVHHSNGSYLGEPDEGELEHRLTRLHRSIEMIGRLQEALDGGADIRDRLRRATERLQKAEARAESAVGKYRRASAARVSRLTAELEQMRRALRSRLG